VHCRIRLCRIQSSGWLTVYSLVVARARALFGRPRIRRWLDALTGCVLIGLGVRLAAEQR
jgi:threonine/homoserine/homoserine lactone efflux protein